MAVEARSLASITQLASNPPLYPHNPAERPCPALTLYILRVPGSKDVFLSPLKPQSRVVNAHDVQSSLYFLHVHDAEDARRSESLPSPSHELDPWAESLAPSRNSSSRVTRKPLPTPPMTPEMEHAMTFEEMKPASALQNRGVPRRKPVLPRRDSSTVTHPPPQTVDVLPSSNEEQHCVALTLIRRDPASGAQWNVATIRDPPVEDISSEANKAIIGANLKAKSSGAPLYIELDNPGYSKFLQQNQVRPTSRDSESTCTTDFENQYSAHETRFKRRLWMDGSRFGDHTYTHRKNVHSGASSNPSRLSVHTPGGSWLSTSRSAIDRRSKSYAFKSPWGGKCEFSTNTAGRSLRCHHRLLAPVSKDESVSNVSELRFNLPTKSQSGYFGSSSANTDSYSAPFQFSHDPVGHRHTKSEPINDLEPHWASIRDENGDIDYSLGRERAGGGFGGKQAKLGKLIIEDEGQKMLDLVVAANMALWWRAYERS